MSIDTLKEVMGAEKEAQRILDQANKDYTKTISDGRVKAAKLETDFEDEEKNLREEMLKDVEKQITAEKKKLDTKSKKDLAMVEKAESKKQEAVKVILKQFEGMLK